jgi:hypothetical protein
MQKLKTGKEEIIYLLTRAIEKYKLDTGQEIVQNTNRKNYEKLAILLSEISNQLPQRAEEWGTAHYAADVSGNEKKYPYRKYDITGGQIKDALIGIVSNPRPFLVDATYVYLFGIGRASFELQPIDDNLVQKTEDELRKDTEEASTKNLQLQQQVEILQADSQKHTKKSRIGFAVALFIGFVTIAISIFFIKTNREWETIKADMNILPYKPTASEIDSLEGIWLCYTGSPQARISDPKRYHKVVSNLIEIKYKNGYFVFTRYGASFNHIGYMQFESPGIVSVYSRINTNSAQTESPRHSLLNLHTNKNYLAAISASWNFDVGEKNKIIGIRELYIKQGKEGNLEEVINKLENAECQCKIVKWHKTNNAIKTFYLKNELLDSLKLDEVKSLIDEKSILLGLPEDGLLMGADTVRTNN